MNIGHRNRDVLAITLGTTLKACSNLVVRRQPVVHGSRGTPSSASPTTAGPAESGKISIPNFRFRPAMALSVTGSRIKPTWNWPGLDHVRQLLRQPGRVPLVEPPGAVTVQPPIAIRAIGSPLPTLTVSTAALLAEYGGVYTLTLEDLVFMA